MNWTHASVIGVVVAAITLLAALQITPRREVRVRVDTLRIETTTHDSVTVISRAADTIRVMVKEVGPLTEKDLVDLICSSGWVKKDRNGDEFEFNGYGMVFCPVKDKEDK